MNIQPQPQTELTWFLPYSPITTELDGLSRINGGMKIIWFEITEGNLAYWRRVDKRTVDDGFCLGLGVVLILTGIWQLRAPIITGVAGCVFANYFK